jgi:hypothetical protein
VMSWSCWREGAGQRRARDEHVAATAGPPSAVRFSKSRCGAAWRLVAFRKVCRMRCDGTAGCARCSKNTQQRRNLPRMCGGRHLYLDLRRRRAEPIHGHYYHAASWPFWLRPPVQGTGHAQSSPLAHCPRPKWQPESGQECTGR